MDIKNNEYILDEFKKTISNTKSSESSSICNDFIKPIHYKKTAVIEQDIKKTT